MSRLVCDDDVISQSGGNIDWGNGVDTALYMSAGPLLATGLSSSTEWGLAYALGGAQTVNTDAAPILAVWGGTLANATIKYDGNNAPTKIRDSDGYNGWGLSHAYIPAGTSSLTLSSCSRGCIIFHGSKTYTFPATAFTADHDGYAYLVINVGNNNYTVYKNEVSYSYGVSIFMDTSGYGLGYASIPVETGDDVSFRCPYACAVIY